MQTKQNESGELLRVSSVDRGTSGRSSPAHLPCQYCSFATI